MHPVCVCCHWQWEVTSVYMTTSCSRAPKGRDEGGHGSEGWPEKEGDHCENEEPLRRSKKDEVAD